MSMNGWKFCLLLLFLANCESTRRTSFENYLSPLMKFIEKNSTNYQVVILINNKTEYSNNNDMINEILSKFPCLVINSSTRNNKLVSLPVFDEPRATSFFIIIANEVKNNNLSKLNIIDSINFMRALSPNRIRPKCLIITFSIVEEKILYKELLKFMWLKFFLDTTIFQLEIKELDGNWKRLLNIYSKPLDASLHSFNPFTGEYRMDKFSHKDYYHQWFPNKLQNMNGYKLIAGAYPNPPYSQLKFNATGSLIKYWGADFVAFDAIAKAMNFSFIIVSFANASLGVINLNNNTAGSMLGMCVRNEIDILLTTVLFSRDSKRTVTEFTRMVNWENVYAIVPIIQGEKKIVENSELYKTFTMFLLVVAFFSIITRLFRYEQLGFINIIGVLTGVCVENETSLIHERLLFMSILFLGFLCGSIFFAGFTDMNMHVTSTMEFNTFNDLDRSGLIPLVHVNMFDVTFGEDDGGPLLRLKQKTRKVTTNCLLIVLKDVNQSLSCLKSGSNVAAVIEMSKNESGRPTLTAMKETFWGFRSVMNLGRASPYKERVNEIILRLTESGLRDKWNEPYSSADTLIRGKSQNSSEEDDFGYVENLLQILLFVALHGYLIAFSAFLAEISFKYFLRLISFFRQR